MFRLVKISGGILPLKLFIPITAGKGPDPDGNATFEVKVIECPFTVILTVSVPEFPELSGGIDSCNAIGASRLMYQFRSA